MIEQDEIDAIKQNTDLKALVESRGIGLKKNGNGYMGLCHFHDDKNPSLSINPDKNLWQCFGCGKAGDVIRFVELYDSIGFAQAVEKLSGHEVKKVPSKAPDKTKPNTIGHQKILTRVIEFYHTTFSEDPRAKEYLASRGITENKLFAGFKIGFSNGTLQNVLPDDGEITTQLKELGILNPKGTEHFYGCVTFPLFDTHHNPVGVYGRRLPDMVTGNSAIHLYLPGPRLGVFNWQTAKSHDEIILTESIIDSLTLMQNKILNTIPCYGVNGLTPCHLTLFEQYPIQTIHICFDADNAGKEGAPREMSDKDKSTALCFLKNPDMFDEILNDFETIGYTGEGMNKLLCYIAAVSRKMDEPLSVMIQSRSAAGKSFLQDTVLSLIPEEDCIKYTRLTDQALFYKGKDSLKHKILAIEELDGMNGAIYSIRSIRF